jgi:hypothetical protein
MWLENTNPNSSAEFMTTLFEPIKDFPSGGWDLEKVTHCFYKGSRPTPRSHHANGCVIYCGGFGGLMECFSIFYREDSWKLKVSPSSTGAMINDTYFKPGSIHFFSPGEVTQVKIDGLPQVWKFFNYEEIF